MIYRTHFINPRNPKRTICGHKIEYLRYKDSTIDKTKVNCSVCLISMRNQKIISQEGKARQEDGFKEPMDLTERYLHMEE